MTTPPAAANRGLAPSQSGPDAANMHTEPNDDASEDNPLPDTLAAWDREIMLPPPPRPLHAVDHLDPEELRRLNDIYHRTPSPNLVDAHRVHFQGVCGDQQFAAALLPHGATNIRVRHHQALLTLGQQTPDDLVDVWISWFKCHQPDQGRVWVLHLAWAHTLIAPPTETRPAPNPGGRTRAASQLNANSVNISPHGGLSVLGKQDGQGEGTKIPDANGRAGGIADPPPRDAPSTVALVVL